MGGPPHGTGGTDRRDRPEQLSLRIGLRFCVRSCGFHGHGIYRLVRDRTVLRLVLLRDGAAYRQAVRFSFSGGMGTGVILPTTVGGTFRGILLRTVIQYLPGVRIHPDAVHPDCVRRGFVGTVILRVVLLGLPLCPLRFFPLPGLRPCPGRRGLLLLLQSGGLFLGLLCLPELFLLLMRRHHGPYVCPQPGEDLHRGHTHKEHDDERQGDDHQHQRPGQPQTPVQEPAQQSAQHAAAFPVSPGAEQLRRVDHRGHRRIRGANAHMDESGDQQHEQKGEQNLQAHHVLATVPPPGDSHHEEDRGEQQSRPAEQPEQASAQVEADEAHPVLLIGVRLTEYVQHETNDQEQPQCPPQVGQVLLGKDPGPALFGRRCLGVGGRRGDCRLPTACPSARRRTAGGIRTPVDFIVTGAFAVLTASGHDLHSFLSDIPGHRTGQTRPIGGEAV